MPWARLQSAYGTGTTSANTSGNPFPSNLTAGSTMIAVAATNGQTAQTPTVTVADAASNAFIQIATTGMVTVDDGSLWLFALNTPSGDAGTKPTITATDNRADFVSILVVEFSGIVTGATLGALVDGTPGTSDAGTGSPITSPSYSSSVAGELLISAVGDNSSYTWTKPANLSADPNNLNGSAFGDASLAYGNSTGGSESEVWTFTGSGGQWGSILCAFQLTSVAGPPLVPLPGSRPVVVAGYAGQVGAGHSR